MNDLLWPAARLGEALHALLSHSSVDPSFVAHALVRAASPLMATPSAETQQNPDSLAEWLQFAAQSLGFEAQSAETSYPDLEHQLPAMGPAIIQVPSEPAFLALLPGTPLRILGPDLQPHHISASTIRSQLCSHREAPLRTEIQQLLNRAGVPPQSQPRATDAILRERLSATHIKNIWLLRLPPSANFRTQLKQARVPRRLALLGGAHAIQYVLWILAWWVVGSNVLNRRADQSWLFLWSLLLLTLVPLRVWITWLQGLLAIGAGARLKQRLFLGALKLEPDSIRHQGAGQLLGRVLESEAVESLALSGGFLALVALIELAASIVVLSLGAGGAVQAGLLIAWLAVAAWITWRYYQRNRTWTDTRLRMTHDLVESMVGHRTRLAQLPPDRWHRSEDEQLESYLQTSKAMDDSTAALLALVPRGWLVLGLIGLAPVFVRGASTASMAIAVGGMLLAYRALARCTTGAWQVAGAAVAWERVSTLFQSAAKKETTGSLEAATAPGKARAADVAGRAQASDAVGVAHSADTADSAQATGAPHGAHAADAPSRAQSGDAPSRAQAADAPSRAPADAPSRTQAGDAPGAQASEEADRADTVSAVPATGAEAASSTAGAEAAVEAVRAVDIVDAGASDSGTRQAADVAGAAGAARTVIDARDLTFRYSEKTPPVLRGCSIRITPGERVVLEGASGGGKSTLVSLLVGLREPNSGQVLARGLDRQTTGDQRWRKYIAAAPQFHENHVLAETFAFNLMMGRHKIPSPSDFPEAEEICRELGLGELLERMPAGLLQMVGETGWQLSHGERSRLYIARALLQDADLVILDESFAALDPVNLQHALACVVKRARSLLVIAHR